MPADFQQGFSVRQPAWHGLATVLGDYPGREEAMRLAGHDFQVVELPVSVNAASLNEGAPTTIRAEGWKALAKDSDGSLLNIVRDTYQVVQNEVLWDIVDALVEQPNVKYETAGVLKGGAVLWVLGYLDEPVTLPGDNSAVYPYIATSTTHDGSGGVIARATSVRIICWNTLNAAEAESRRTGREFHFRHTRRVHERIEMAKEVLKGVREDFTNTMELFRDLIETPVTDGQVEQFLERFVPLPAAEVVSDRVKGNVMEARDLIRGIIHGPTQATTSGTAYGLVQAGIEYLDHLRGFRTKETYLGRTMLRQEPLKAKLVPMVRELVAV